MKLIKSTYWIGKEILNYKNVLIILLFTVGFSYFIGVYFQLYVSDSGTLAIGNSKLTTNAVFRDLTTIIFLFFSIYNIVILYILKNVHGLLIDKSFLTHALVKPISRKGIYLATISFSFLFLFISNTLFCLLITSFSFIGNGVYLSNFVLSIILLLPYSLFISIIYNSLVYLSLDKITGFVYLFIYTHVAPGIFEYIKILFIKNNQIQIIRYIEFLVNEVLFGAGYLSYHISLYQVHGFTDISRYFYSAFLPIFLSYFIVKRFDKINI